MVNHCMARYTQRLVDSTEPPNPTDPEIRIQQFQDMIDSGLLEIDQELRIKARISQLQSLIDSMAGSPTIYRPDPKLKGGK